MSSSDEQISTKSQSWARIGIWLILGIAATLRLYQLGAKSLWTDEIGQAWYARMGVLEAIQGATHHIAAAPLDYFIMSLVMFIGQSEFVIRLPAAVWGILSVYVLYRLGRYLFRSETIGLTAAFLLAIAPLPIEMSQEARFYSLFLFLGLVSSTLFAYALREPSRKAWIVFATVLTLSMLSHYYTVFLIAAMSMIVILAVIKNRIPTLNKLQISAGREVWFPFGISVAIALGAGTLWYLYSRGGAPSTFSFQPPSSYEVIAGPIMGIQRRDPFFGLWILPLLALLGIILGLRRRNVWTVFLAFFPCIVVPITLILLQASSYFYSPRQLLFIVPYYLLLIAGGTVYGGEIIFRSSKRASIAVGILLVAASVFSYPQIQAYYNNPNPHWREVALFLRTLLERHPDQAIVTAPPYLDRLLTYYQPSLEAYMLDPDMLTKAPDYPPKQQRIWLIAQQEAFPQRVTKDWSKLNLGRVLGGFQFYYLGLGIDGKALQKEYGHLSPLPEMVASSWFLPPLYGIDREEGLALTEQEITFLDYPTTSLLGSERHDLLVQIARVLYEAGQIDRAIQYIDRARSYEQNDPNTLVNAGLIYIRANRCQEATSFLLSNPNLRIDGNANSVLGGAYRCLKQWDQAVQAYQYSYSLKSNPGDLLSQARVYIDAGQIEQARQVVEKLQKEYPQSPELTKAQELMKATPTTTPK